MSAPVRRSYVFGVGVFAWIAFVALAVMGLGIGTVVTDQDVVTDPQAGLLAGIIMFVVALAIFIVGSASFAMLRRDRASVLVALFLGVVTWIAYCLGAVPAWLISVALSGRPDTDAPRIFVAGFFALESAIRWPAIVVGLAAAMAAWGYLAMIARAVRLAGTRDFGTSHTHYRDTGV